MIQIFGGSALEFLLKDADAIAIKYLAPKSIKSRMTKQIPVAYPSFNQSTPTKVLITLDCAKAIFFLPIIINNISIWIVICWLVRIVHYYS